MQERDFIGYGANPPAVRWPGDARIAISVVVNYEEGSEASLLDGDDHHESNNEVRPPFPPTSATCSTSRFSSTAAAWASGES